MGDDAIAGSSIIQTHAEKAHREHLQHHLHYGLHRRQAAKPAGGVVTTTIGVIQEIQLDSSGNTIAIVNITPSTSPSTPIPVVAPAASLTTPAGFTTPVPPTTGTPTGLYSTIPPTAPITPTPQSLPPSQVPAATASPLLTGKPVTGLNSSTPTDSINSLALGSSLSSNITLSTITGSKSKSGKPGSSRSSLRTTLSPSTTTTIGQLSSLLPLTTYITTDAAGHTHTIVAGAAAGTGANSPESTSDAAGTTNSNASVPPTPVLVGGIVGGMAGVAFVLLVLLFFVRWKKRSPNMLAFGRSDGSSTAGIASRDGRDPPQSGSMAERSIPSVIPAALAALTGRNKRASHAQSASSTAGSERGFYRVSGRKLPSVLQSGGDGYGGGSDDQAMFSNLDTLNGTSFYQDSQGFHGGPGTPQANRDSGIPIMRPSPARTPVTQQGPFAPPPLPSPFDIPPPRVRPDGLGRSHPSQDGSHGSRFTEEIV